VTVQRTGWCGEDVPGLVTVRIGPIVRGPDKQPAIGEATDERRAVLDELVPLQQEDFRGLLEAMPEWLRQPLRVVAAADCTTRKAVLAEVLARPDGRMAPYLRRFKAESGCGILGMQDCWSCERRDIRAALSAVDAAARSGSGTDAGG
jgi:hypothetical protein